MITNVIEAENAAIREFEGVLIASGWADGWAMNDAEVRQSVKPIFYRNNAPVVAAETRIKKGYEVADEEENIQTKYLYGIYNITQTTTNYSGNRPYYNEVTVAISIYYDDPSIFYEAEGAQAPENVFAPFVTDLTDKLTEKYWTVSSEGESTVPATDDGTVYTNRKILIATKNF